jgi:hypothetical protein
MEFDIVIRSPVRLGGLLCEPYGFKQKPGVRLIRCDLKYETTRPVRITVNIVFFGDVVSD